MYAVQKAAGKKERNLTFNIRYVSDVNRNDVTAFKLL